jgi:cobalt-zinc-cadmium efflux system protein
MLIVLGLTSVYMVVEVVTGLMTGSLAMLADAGHMLSDVGALLLGLLAVWFSSRPATSGKTYGYYRSEILAGFFNALMLVAISIFILYEAYHRLFNPPTVVGLPVLLVAILGLAINVCSLRLLKTSAQDSINARAAYLEILGDSLASFGVILSSTIILLTGWYIADPIVSGLIGLWILPRTWLLLSECINILMEGTPGHVNISDLRKSLLAVPGVIDVHDIHVWTITSGLDAMSGHVTIDNRAPAEEVLTAVTKILNDEFHLHHTTIQVEQIECKGIGEICSK